MVKNFLKNCPKISRHLPQNFLRNVREISKKSTYAIIHEIFIIFSQNF